MIKILNPLPGGSDYTNPKRAEHFVKMKRAVWASPRSIRFTHRREVQLQVDAERKLAIRSLLSREPWRGADDERLIAGRRDGALPWNGCDERESAFHLPFTSQVFKEARMRIPTTAQLTDVAV